MRRARARGNALTIVAAVIAAGGVLWASIAALDAPPSGKSAGGLASGGGSGVAGVSGTTKLPTAKKRRGAHDHRAARGLLPQPNSQDAGREGRNCSGDDRGRWQARQYLTDNPEELMRR